MFFGLGGHTTSYAAIAKIVNNIGLRWLGSKRLASMNFHWNQITELSATLIEK